MINHFMYLIVLLLFRHKNVRHPHYFPTRRSSDLTAPAAGANTACRTACSRPVPTPWRSTCSTPTAKAARSEEHTSELQSRENLVCRLLLEKKKRNLYKKALYI